MEKSNFLQEPSSGLFKRRELLTEKKGERKPFANWLDDELLHDTLDENVEILETEPKQVGFERFMIPALQDTLGRKNSGKNRSARFS